MGIEVGLFFFRLWEVISIIFFFRCLFYLVLANIFSVVDFNDFGRILIDFVRVVISMFLVV